MVQYIFNSTRNPGLDQKWSTLDQKWSTLDQIWSNPGFLVLFNVEKYHLYYKDDGNGKWFQSKKVMFNTIHLDICNGLFNVSRPSRGLRFV